jgi:hypothetical protein
MISEELIKRIAEEIYNQQFHGHIWLYLLIVALVFLSTCLGSFVYSYSKERGKLSAIDAKFDEILQQMVDKSYFVEKAKNIATKEDFNEIKQQIKETAYIQEIAKQLATKDNIEEIKEQLRQTTRTSEEVKAEVHNMYQHQLDMKHIKREKLEDVFKYINDVFDYLEYQRNEAVQGNGILSKHSPIGILEAVLQMYFKDVGNEFLSFKNCYAQIFVFVNEFIPKMAMFKGGLSTELPTLNLNKYIELLKPLHHSANSLKKVLVEKYSERLGLEN